MTKTPIGGSGGQAWTMSYVYDAEGNRVQSSKVGTWTYRYANMNGHVIADLYGDNSLREQYLRGDQVDQLFGRVDVMNGSPRTGIRSRPASGHNAHSR